MDGGAAPFCVPSGLHRRPRRGVSGGPSACDRGEFTAGRPQNSCAPIFAREGADYGGGCGASAFLEHIVAASRELHVERAPRARPDSGSRTLGTASLSSTASPLANDASPSTMSGSMYERSDAEEEELMDSGRPPSHAKMRKVSRLSVEQRTSLAVNTTLGESRMRLATNYSNRVPRTLNTVASAYGCARTSASFGCRGSCNSASLLASYDPHFDLAKRSQHEIALRTSGLDESKSAYNYSGLRTVVIERLFDGSGNWTVHEACARDCLRVSNWWLARCHTRAINAAQMPTKRMTKAMIAASPIVDALISRIRRPDNCVLGALQYFKAASVSDVMDVVRVTKHGHTGAPSNRTKVDEQVKVL